MARTLYGGSTADVIPVVDQATGDYEPQNVAYTVWTTRTGGVQVTDLLTFPGNVATTTVSPNSAGQLIFYGPDPYTGPLYLKDPASRYWVINPDISGRAGTSAVSSVDGLVGAVFEQVPQTAAALGAAAAVHTHDTSAFTSGPLSIERMAAGSTIVVYRTAAGAWPARPTTRTDVVICWRGPLPKPTIGGTGAVASLDTWDDGTTVIVTPPPPPVVAPVNTVIPVITTDGTPQVGDTVTCSTGTWSNSPASYAYVWKRAGTSISGATASAYTLVTADASTAVTCTVTATNTAGSASATSAAINVVAAGTGGGSPPVVHSIKQNYGGLYDTAVIDNHQWIKTGHAALWTGRQTYGGIAALANTISSNPGTTYRIHIDGGGHGQNSSAPALGQGDSGAWMSTYGAPVLVKNSQAGVTGYCPQYWTTASGGVNGYREDFALFCAALGNALDGFSNLASVNMSGCSLIYAEPWIMGSDTGTGNSLDRLYQAGLTQATQAASIYAGIAAMVNAFPTTVVEFAGHSQLNYPTSGGGQGGKLSDALAMANILHTTYGNQICITDYGLGPGEGVTPQPLASATSWYGWMGGRGKIGYPVAFQTTGSTSQTAAEGACQAAVSMYGAWFEHSGWATYLTSGDITTYNAQLKANLAGYLH